MSLLHNWTMSEPVAATSTSFLDEALFRYTFEDIAPAFQSLHKDPISVGIHMLTTPLGMIGAMSLIRSYSNSSTTNAFIFFCYLVSLLPALTTGVYICTAMTCFVIFYLTKMLKLSTPVSVAMIAISYALQDLVHAGVGEETYQSTYSDGGHVDLANPMTWSKMFFEHVYYLLPLCVYSTMELPMMQGTFPDQIAAILNNPLPGPLQQLRVFAKYIIPVMSLAYGSYCLDSKNMFCFFPGAPYFHRVLQCNICNDEGESQKKSLQTVRKWAMKQNPPADKSSHWWYRDLVGNEKAAFDACATCTQIYRTFRSLFSERHYCVDVVSGMNEIYVTGPARFDQVGNSDNVFYTKHVDGPLGFIPFASVYRCIVGMDKNEMVTTHFPLADISSNACEGDVLAFDFNREVHFITRDDTKKGISDDYRVVLKLHYCVYPRVLWPLGQLLHFLNVKYNQLFRALFLTTIDPTTTYQHFLAWNVNSQTVAFNALETYVGLRSLFYVSMVAAIWYFTGVYEVFFALTSYVHYFRYITTFYVRRDIDFGSFKRDVLLFKSLALIQLFYHYLISPLQRGTFQVDVISIGMIASGYICSMLATNALGIDRTYFGAELGLLEPKWVDQFPYGYIPHPMIVSQIWALLGFMKADHFRTEWPYVIPIHVLLYSIHMLQEEFNIYDRTTDGKAVRRKRLEEY